MCAKIQIYKYGLRSNTEVKKSLESCYKTQRKFCISEQLNKETEIKKYIWHKKKH
jgi:hypothetical protein